MLENNTEQEVHPPNDTSTSTSHSSFLTSSSSEDNSSIGTDANTSQPQIQNWLVEDYRTDTNKNNTIIKITNIHHAVTGVKEQKPTPKELLANVVSNPLFPELQAEIQKECSLHALPISLFNTYEAASTLTSIAERTTSIHQRLEEYPLQTKTLSKVFNVEASKIESLRHSELRRGITDYKEWLIHHMYDNQIHRLLDRVEQSLALLEQHNCNANIGIASHYIPNINSHGTSTQINKDISSRDTIDLVPSTFELDYRLDNSNGHIITGNKLNIITTSMKRKAGESIDKVKHKKARHEAL